MNKATKAVIAVLIALLFLGTGIYSAVQAQSPDAEMNRLNNAGKTVHHHPDADLSAEAVPLNNQINSPYAELKPAMAPSGNRLYFSRSLHPLNTAGGADQEDIWYSEFDKTANSWSEPIRMAGLLNNDGPNFINNVSVTGDTIILGNQYLKNGKMRAGVSYSVNVNGEWSLPVSIFIRDDYNMSNHANAFVNLKTGVIIKAIERAETFGQRDLYVSFWDGVKATEPINMGNVINSDLEESSPYLAPDNKTLYFASKGHNGYGGYDIFASKRLDESWTNWSRPENLGPAVNGPLDEEFFTITHGSEYAIFSKQVSVHNFDLYKIPMQKLFVTPAKAETKKTVKPHAHFVDL